MGCGALTPKTMLKVIFCRTGGVSKLLRLRATANIKQQVGGKVHIRGLN